MKAEASEQRVWISQCLCGPHRHAIIAGAAEASSETEAKELALKPLRKAVHEAIVDGVINPWCGICGAEHKGWRYEVGRSKFRTMEEAMPALAEMQEQNLLAHALYGGQKGPGRPN